METVTVNKYNFEELSEESKERARDWWKDNGIGEHESEEITESFKNQLKSLGLPSEDVRWKLSSCQGDGVAFYGSVDVEEYLTKNKIKTKFRKLFDSDKDLLIENVGILKSTSCHMYDHYNTMLVSYNEALYGGYENTIREQALEDFVEHLDDHVKSLSHAFVKEGMENIDYLLSDDYVDECLEQYEFTEEGVLF